jgi:hypothetical protein
MKRTCLQCLAVAVLLTNMACGGSDSTPTGPSQPQSFLTGTWRGTLTIEPDAPAGGVAPDPISGDTVWVFEVVPQTNRQSFRATVRSQNAWLPLDTVGTTTVVPGNTPPAQISTQGDYTSPRGCRGTYGSFGTAQATRIEADFIGVDCSITFKGRVVLTKQ